MSEEETPLPTAREVVWQPISSEQARHHIFNLSSSLLKVNPLFTDNLLRYLLKPMPYLPNELVLLGRGFSEGVRGYNFLMTPLWTRLQPDERIWLQTPNLLAMYYSGSYENQPLKFWIPKPEIREINLTVPWNIIKKKKDALDELVLMSEFKDFRELSKPTHYHLHV
jgi:hypothetical protein